MKKFVRTILLVAFVCFSSTAHAKDDLQDVADNTDNLWRTGAGAHDGSYTAISASMIGWGVGLAIVIAVLCAVLHQSTSSSAHNSSNGHCH